MSNESTKVCDCNQGRMPCTCKAAQTCPGHNRAECVSCCWPRHDTDNQWTPAQCAALGEMEATPLEFNKIGTGYTAVDMTTAAAQGFRDGAASVVVELPKLGDDEGYGVGPWEFGYSTALKECKERIIAAGGSVKE